MLGECATPFEIVYTDSRVGQSANSWAYKSSDVHALLTEEYS